MALFDRLEAANRDSVRPLAARMRPRTLDEFAGQFLTLLVLPAPGWGGIALGFVLFRIFDIFKPGPIDAVQRLPGATGVMADDLLAGLAAGACLFALRLVLPI